MNTTSTTKLPNREETSIATKVLYDTLADGQRHNLATIKRAVKKNLYKHEFPNLIRTAHRNPDTPPKSYIEAANRGVDTLFNRAVREAEKKNQIKISHQGQYVRMYAKYVPLWKAQMGNLHYSEHRPVFVEQKYGKVAYYGEYTEWEGWAQAPLVSYSGAHAKIVESIDLDELKHRLPGWYVQFSPEGLLTVGGPVDSPTVDVLKEVLTDMGIAFSNAKAIKNLRRRDLNELPEAFKAEMFERMSQVAHSVVLGKMKNSMAVLTDSVDDARAYASLWTVELATCFDPSRRSPFEPWLRNQLKFKVQDLNRKISGRRGSDMERNIGRAVEQVEAREGRPATADDIAKELGIDRDTYAQNKKTVTQVKSLRTYTPLDDSTSITAKESIEDEILELEKAQRVTCALVNTMQHRPTETSGAIGFLATYLSFWGGKTFVEVGDILRRDPVSISQSVRKVTANIADELVDFADAR